MLVTIKVIANAKKNALKEESGRIKVYVAAPPVKGKANKLLFEILADYFNVNKNKISIIKGEYSSTKVVQVNR
ncbi:MAG: DUF167 domain-containing protein [Candidatus Omnitrophota bacterium]